MAEVTVAELRKTVPLYTSALSQLRLEVGRLRDEAVEHDDLHRGGHAANGTAAATKGTAGAAAGRRRGGVLSALATVGQAGPSP